jgi:hypothetical protein
MRTHPLVKVISVGLIIAVVGAFAPIAYAQGVGAAGGPSAGAAEDGATGGSAPGGTNGQ